MPTYNTILPTTAAYSLTYAYFIQDVSTT